jgi:hypothetical protein
MIKIICKGGCNYPTVVCDQCDKPIVNMGNVYFDSGTGEIKGHLHKGDCDRRWHFEHGLSYTATPYFSQELFDHLFYLGHNAGMMRGGRLKPEKVRATLMFESVRRELKAIKAK